MKVKTLAIMALLGEISTVDLKRKSDESMVLLRKEFENDDGDQFMADSIKEAEAEVAAQKKAHSEGRFYQPSALADQAEQERQKSEEDLKKATEDPQKKKAINAMTQSIIDDALNSHASIVFENNGGINIDVVDGGAETKMIRENNMKAIKDALKDRNNELGLKSEVKKEVKKVEAPAPVNVTATAQIKETPANKTATVEVKP
jgi:hypothetical protein